MILEDTKEKLEQYKRAFEWKQKSIYGIENKNYTTRIHDKEVNKIYECNLLHHIINPPKHTKKLNSHYSPIKHGFMNTGIGKSKFKNFRILLDSGFISMILMGRLVEKYCLEKDTVIQWHT